MKKLIQVIAVAMILAPVSQLLAKGPDKLKPVKPQDVQKIEAAIPAKAPATPKKKRKILVIWRCDGFFHKSIPIGNKMIELLGKKTGAYEAVIPETASEQMDLFTDAKLAEFDAICFNNTTRLTPNAEQQAAIMKFVHSAKGVIGIHAASDNFYKWKEGAKMMGGLFAGHPWRANGTWAVKIENSGSPINKSFNGKTFKIKDEIYNMKDPYTRTDRRILLSLDMNDPVTGAKKGRADKDQAVAWIKKCGAGRVFYCSLGHNGGVYETPNVVAHYLAGFQYALGDLAADDTPVAK